MSYTIDLKNQFKDIHPIKLPVIKQEGPIDFTNYYMEKDGEPFIGISGEFHFSRYPWQKWEDEIIKMKMGGINIIATYVFWNHHEEVRGTFNWEEERNLKLFVELCAKHDMLVILRIGPFDHGEVRNGGLPDWLFGLPFDVRSNDAGYLKLVRRLYQEISYQVEGLYITQNGPIMAIQLENEFCHSAAPWEFTAGTTDEWVSGGSGGEEHISNLQKIAIESGLTAQFYTATAWGGALAPTNLVLPLWGGYAFWPWIFYDKSITEHPATPEYIFHDYHNNKKAEFYNFDPRYQPEDVPFACCEMQGGMTNFYEYRFQIPHESTAAMAAIKLAGGCNFVGYYMYHGGTNPDSMRGVYLNENATPKKSYDYQAAIGQYGQLRQSYHELKKIHFFLENEKKVFAKTKTFLPKGAEEIDPTDLETLRYAVRVADDAGYLFINNYQDHLEMPAKENLQITLELENETLSIPSKPTLSIGSGISGILPFNYQTKIGKLKYATAQLVSSFDEAQTTHYIFSEISGMEPEFLFDHHEEPIKIEAEEKKTFTVKKDDSEIVIHYLPTSEISKLWKVKDKFILSNGVPISKNGEVVFEVHENTFELTLLEESKNFDVSRAINKSDLMTKAPVSLKMKRITDRKISVSIPPIVFEGVKEVLLKVRYSGDVGYAFIDGHLVDDNFNNGSEWEIGLMKYREKLKYEPLILSTVPLKDSRQVKSDSPMAAKIEISEEAGTLFQSIDFDIIQEVTVDL